MLLLDLKHHRTMMESSHNFYQPPVSMLFLSVIVPSKTSKLPPDCDLSSVTVILTIGSSPDRFTLKENHILVVEVEPNLVKFKTGCTLPSTLKPARTNADEFQLQGTNDNKVQASKAGACRDPPVTTIAGNMHSASVNLAVVRKS